MKIIVNGQKEDLTETLSLKQYLKKKGRERERIVVEYNKKVVKKNDWDTIILKEEDKLEILRFVGGG